MTHAKHGTPSQALSDTWSEKHHPKRKTGQRTKAGIRHRFSVMAGDGQPPAVTTTNTRAELSCHNTQQLAHPTVSTMRSFLSFFALFLLATGVTAFVPLGASPVSRTSLAMAKQTGTVKWYARGWLCHSCFCLQDNDGAGSILAPTSLSFLLASMTLTLRILSFPPIC